MIPRYINDVLNICRSTIEQRQIHPDNEEAILLGWLLHYQDRIHAAIYIKGRISITHQSFFGRPLQAGFPLSIRFTIFNADIPVGIANLNQYS